MKCYVGVLISIFVIVVLNTIQGSGLTWKNTLKYIYNENDVSAKLIRVYQKHNSEVANVLRLYSPPSLSFVDNEEDADVVILHNSKNKLQTSKRKIQIVIEHDFDESMRKTRRLKSWQRSIVTASPLDIARVTDLNFQPKCHYYQFPFGANSHIFLSLIHI